MLSMIGCGTSRPQVGSTSEADRLIGIARLFEQQGKAEFAENLYAKVLRTEPNHPEAITGLARLTGADQKVRPTSEEMLAKNRKASDQQPEANQVQLTAIEEPTDNDPADRDQAVTQAISQSDAGIEAAIETAPEPPAVSDFVETQPAAAGFGEFVADNNDAPLPTEPEFTAEAEFTAEDEFAADMEVTAEPEFTADTNFTTDTEFAEPQPEDFELPVIRPTQSVARDTPIFEEPIPVATSDSDSGIDAATGAFDFGSTASDAVETPAAPEQIELSPELQALVDSLNADDNGSRLIATFDLGELGAAAAPASPILEQKLDQEIDPMVRVLLAEALAKIEPTNQTATMVLTASLASSSDSVHQLAVLAISNLIERLSTSDTEAAQATLKLLAPQVRPSLARAMGHDAAIVRTAARNGFTAIETL